MSLLSPITRRELLSGDFNLERRVTRLLSRIEARVSYLRSEIHHALLAHLLADQTYARQLDDSYTHQIQRIVTLGYRLTLADLERFAPQWAGLVDADVQVRACLLRRLAQRFALQLAELPRLRAALDLDSPALAAAFEQRYKQPLMSLASGAWTSITTPDPEPGPPALIDHPAVEWHYLAGGETLFATGEASDTLFIVLSGRLRVTTTQPQGELTVVAEIGRGELVGEMEVLTGTPRTSSVSALRDSELLRVPKDAFDSLSREYPQALSRIGRLLADRLTTALTLSTPRSARLATVALVPLGNLPPGRFVRQLASAMAGYARPRLLSSATVDQEHGEAIAQTSFGDPDNTRLVHWLNEQEQHYDVVIYEADAALTPWTIRCLRQADRVLLVADASGDATVGMFERQVNALNVTTPFELVLLHRPDTRLPSGTANWLKPRRILRHYHVRQGDDAQIARVARRLLGRATGLVLGGGGARGYAHVGVLRALDEAGIVVDCIGGTSMGAWIGALYAFGLSGDEMYTRGAPFASRRRLLDQTLPLGSWFGGLKLNTVFQSFLGETPIEDLWRPYFCVSTNLSRNQPLIHREGTLWRAVRASTAVPGIFAPVLADSGDVLVDGGVVNNLPLDIMRGSGECKPLIGVSLYTPSLSDNPYQFGANDAGWTLLAARLGLTRRAVRAPALIDLIQCSIELHSKRAVESASFRALADLYLHPPVTPYQVLDFDDYEELVALGYAYARAELARWLEQQQ